MFSCVIGVVVVKTSLQCWGGSVSRSVNKNQVSSCQVLIVIWALGKKPEAGAERPVRPSNTHK